MRKLHCVICDQCQKILGYYGCNDEPNDAWSSDIHYCNEGCNGKYNDQKEGKLERILTITELCDSVLSLDEKATE